ncbi:MAG: RagB/SusD family nutrient uptake outer membrane protein [Bacteroides graminisolvens]|nr:RagB/SusD family nutrient uptake outer membrane protein [Bacteroides graminisolvens]
MKIKNILIAGLVAVGFSSCNDFLKVDAISKYDTEYVFSDKTEINRALNGVYAQLLNSSTYGSAYMSTFCLNSDVDMSISTSEVATDNNYRRFDCNSMGGDINKYWIAAFQGVEYANNFIYGLENSPLFSASDAELMQQLGEAKVIRAMFYHDLVVLFGDIPFSLTPNFESDDFVMPVVDREEIHKALIEDLKSIAPYMSFARDLSDGVERVSKEFCWGMIARMALTCGGYSLRPDKNNATSYGTMQRPSNYKDYYQITQAYCDSVVSSGTHSLRLPYRQVFIDQCNYIVNNNDDSMFEIPFAKNSSGSIGYIQGPKGENYEGATSGKNVWGKSDGNARLNAFYRYSFDDEDARRDYVNGMWYYLYDGTPSILTDYTVFNNKWSKFWANSANTLGAGSTGNTGINYPYMRYTDVLLMYAEAVNELEDGVSGTNGAKAIEALRQVRARAFTNSDKIDAYIASASGSKTDFLKAVLNERKWEFAGENMRWKDLVRNNLYGEVLYYSFLRYYAVAENAAGTSDYIEAVEQYDGKPGYLELTLPYTIYYKITNNPNNTYIYPNTTLDVLELYNPYKSEKYPGSEWTAGDYYGWWNDTDGCPKDQCLFSFYGFIRGDRGGNVYLIKDGEIYAQTGASNLPVVRYILPYPNAAIQRSAGQYKNYYGYIK